MHVHVIVRMVVFFLLECTVLSVVIDQRVVTLCIFLALKLVFDRMWLV